MLPETKEFGDTFEKEHVGGLYKCIGSRTVRYYQVGQIYEVVWTKNNGAYDAYATLKVYPDGKITGWNGFDGSFVLVHSEEQLEFKFL